MIRKHIKHVFYFFQSYNAAILLQRAFTDSLHAVKRVCNASLINQFIILNATLLSEYNLNIKNL